MSCYWVEQHCEAGDVELWRNGRPSSALLAHAHACPVCERLVNREVELRVLFAEVAERTNLLEPDPVVKRNLLAELATIRSAQRSRERRGVTARRFVWTMAALVCLVAGVAVVRSLRPHPHGPSTQAGSNTTQVPSLTPDEPVAPVAASAKHVAPKNLPARHREPVQQVSSANGFYPLVMCDSLACPGPAVAIRVELPVSPLAPRNGENRKVMADFLVGEDGLVRGVRVLQ